MENLNENSFNEEDSSLESNLDASSEEVSNDNSISNDDSNSQESLIDDTSSLETESNLEDSSSSPNNDFYSETDSVDLVSSCTLGYRENGMYCNEFGEMVSQLSLDEVCQNNFECEGNLCINSFCVDSDFWSRVFLWIKRWFA